MSAPAAARHLVAPSPGADWALFLDVDGTLLDIAERPDEVSVPRTLIQSLRRTQEALGGAVALVSGRTIAELDHLFDPLHFPVGGQHGAEMRFSPEGTAMPLAPGSPSAGLRRAVAAMMAPIPGILVEDKGLTVAVHYRANPEQGDAIAAAIAKLVEASGEVVELLAGKSVWEVRPVNRDKGQAVSELMATSPFRGRMPVFVGDDVTDADGFAMVEQLGGIALPVGTRNTPRLAAFRDPAAVRDWLRDFVTRLDGGAP